MIVQSNISLVTARSAHSLNASGFPGNNTILYTRLARKVIHDYINATFSHILFPFPRQFSYRFIINYGYRIKHTCNNTDAFTEPDKEYFERKAIQQDN